MTGEVLFKPLPQDDPKQRKPDITKARRLLGWEPKVMLREGLEKSMDYFKACVARERSQSQSNVALKNKAAWRPR